MKELTKKVEALRQEIIGAIRNKLHSYGLNEIRFNEEEDPVWIVWFSDLGDPYECMVTGLRVTDSSFSVFAKEKSSGDEVVCHSPLDLGARNIDWLLEMYEAIQRELQAAKSQSTTEASGRVEW